MDFLYLASRTVTVGSARGHSITFSLNRYLTMAIR